MELHDQAQAIRQIVAVIVRGVLRLALDIVRLARQGQYDVAVIFSQDQDLFEVVGEVREIAQSANRWIKLVCSFPVGERATSRTGIRGTDWIGIDEATYNSCIDPRDYRPRRL
jgi:hypothetical protein